MLGRIEAEQARAIAVQHRGRGDHLGVEQRVRRQQAMEVPAVPVRPVHHRGDAEAVRMSRFIVRRLNSTGARTAALACIPAELAGAFNHAAMSGDAVC